MRLGKSLSFFEMLYFYGRLGIFLAAELSEEVFFALRTGDYKEVA